MIYYFEGGALDVARRELRRGGDVVAVEPQVFDLLLFLLRNRERVVSKDDLLAAVWQRRIVSESTLSSRITAVRQAIGDSGSEQRLIRTVARKGLRFVGSVREVDEEHQAIAPPSGAAGIEASSPPGLPPRPERRQLTIMLCELDTAPGPGSRPDPEALRDAAAAFYARVKAIVAEQGGFAAHCARDAVLAYFGYPRAHEDDAERAIRAALRAVRALSTMPRPLHARVGIDTGLVVVGDSLDDDASSDHAVFGESPGVAASLAASCPRDAVLISAATRGLVGELFECQDVGAVAIAGGPSPLKVWQVLRESATPNRFAALRRYRAELFGRDEEIVGSPGTHLQPPCAYRKPKMRFETLSSCEDGIGE